jgi:NAD(P)H dehydrogenase (quinone)
MPKIAIVYYSAQGHTHTVAEAVQAGAASVAGTTVDLIRIQDSEIQNGRWKNDAAVTTLNAADAIIFGTPTYMGGVSAQVKAFIDGCGGIWYQQLWKNKIAAGFTHSQGLSGDKLNSLQSLFINAMQHSMIWVGLGQMVQGPAPENINRLASFSGAMAATYPAENPVSSGDVETARLLGVRVAEVTKGFGK